MAEDKTDIGEEGAEAVVPAPTASKKKLIIAIVGGLILLLAIGIPATFFLLKDKKTTEELPADAAMKRGLFPKGMMTRMRLMKVKRRLGQFFRLKLLLLTSRVDVLFVVRCSLSFKLVKYRDVSTLNWFPYETQLSHCSPSVKQMM